MKKIYSNAQIFDTKKRKFVEGSLLVDGDRIEAFLPPSCVGVIGVKEIEDMKGARIIPGMVDIHTHGHGGFETTDVDVAGMVEMAKSYAKVGTTSVMVTLMSLPLETLERAISVAKSAKESSPSDAAHILGIHLEGRYISEAKKGAHNPEYLAPLDADELEHLMELAKPVGAFHTIVAPELNGAEEFITRAKKLGATISIGHSNADSETCFEALEWGASSFTHLYNAMSGLGHRSPGCVGAAFASDSYAELICDGVHVVPTAVKAAYKAKGRDKIAIITDSAPSAGLPEGEYMMGGAKVVVRDGAVFLPDGTLTGGSISIFEAMKNLVKFADIKLEDAIICATANPAKVVGMYDEVGSLDGGKRADFLVLDEKNEIARIFVGGAELN